MEYGAPTGETQKRPDSLWWPPYVVFVAWLAISVLVLFVLTARDQAANPPTCHGIGWGCTPDAATTVALYLMLVALPALAVASVIFAAVGLLGRRTRTFRLTLSAGLPPLLFLLLLVLG